MLISERLNAAINDQIRDELGNSNQYLAIAAYLDGDGLSLLAKIYD
jgi:ferritin